MSQENQNNGALFNQDFQQAASESNANPALFVQDNGYYAFNQTSLPPHPILYDQTIMNMQLVSPPNTQRQTSRKSPLAPSQDRRHSYVYSFPSSPYDRSDSDSSHSSIGKQTQSKADRRAEHNATERHRRECLNNKFQQLAFTLPNLQHDSRPSKSTIIDRTLDFVKNAIQEEDRLRHRIKELENFNKILVKQLETFQNGDKQQANTSVTPPVSGGNSSKRRIGDISNTVAIPTIVASPQSIMSEDLVAENNDMYMYSNQSTPVLATKKNPLAFTNTTNQRSVSRSSASMVPKLEYHTVNSTNMNWSTNSDSSSHSNSSHSRQATKNEQYNNSNVSNNSNSHNNTVSQQQPICYQQVSFDHTNTAAAFSTAAPNHFMSSTTDHNRIQQQPKYFEH